MNPNSTVANPSPTPNIDACVKIPKSPLNLESISFAAEEPCQGDNTSSESRDRVDICSVTVARGIAVVEPSLSSISSPSQSRYSENSSRVQVSRPHPTPPPRDESSLSYHSLAESSHEDELIFRQPETASCALAATQRDDSSSFRYPLLRCGSVTSSVSSVGSSRTSASTLVMSSATDGASIVHPNDGCHPVTMAATQGTSFSSTRLDGRLLRDGSVTSTVLLGTQQSVVEDMESSGDVVVNISSGGVTEFGGAVPRTIHTQVS